MRPTTIFTALVVLIAATAAGSGMPFGVAQNLWAGINGPSSVDAADLNRDGYVDVAITTIEADNVSIRFGGPSPWAIILESNFDRACYVKAADVNGDGWIDVVASNRGDASLKVCWWQNPGIAGGTWSRRIVATGADFTQARSVEVGDLDGDGDADIVIAGMAATMSYITWYENADGDGTAWNSWDVTRWYVTFFEGPHDTVIVDINNDGRPDVAAVGYDEDEVAWFENDGTIHNDDCWPMHTVETNFDGAVCVAAADMDDDGDPDIIAGAFLDGEIKWFENRLEQGLSWDDRTIEYALNGVYTVQPIDLDFDGDLDIVASGRGADRVVWYERISSTTFSRHDIATGFDGARSAVAADFDGDGDLDVVAAGEFEDGVAWWQNLSIHRTATFDSREVVSNWGALQPTSVDIADLDQDGDQDIITSRFNETGGADISMWRKDGGVWTRTDVGYSLDGATAARVADINSDGIPDLVGAGSVWDVVRWYQGDGNGAFTQILVAESIDGAKDVDTADFDCDGDIDIAAVAYESGEVLWFENEDGAGTSWTTHVINTFDTPWSLRVSDFDRDGNPDLVVADLTAGRVWALPHFGCGTVWGEIVVDTTFAGPSDVEVGDFNRDGWPDVAAAGYGEQAFTVWLNNGSDWTWNRHDVATNINAWGIAVADLNLDGTLDIVGFGQSSGEVRWWRNNQMGTSWPSNSPLDTSLYGTQGVAVGDIDADGLPDVVATGSNDDAVTFYKSHGGQYIVWNQDRAPGTMGNSETAAIFRIVPLHGGIASDLDMELRNIGIRIDDGSGTALTSAQANALIESVQVWYDADGNGEFSAAGDHMLTVVGDLTPSSGGYDTIPVPHGGPNPAIDGSAFYAFFLVVTTTADASSQTLNRFRISHYNTSPVLGRYYAYTGITLRPVRWLPFHATTVTCGGLSDLIFADGFESGSTGEWTETMP